MAEPVAYRFINGFDNLYDDSKFESLANALVIDDNNFDWDGFGISIQSPFIEEDEEIFDPKFVNINNENVNEMEMAMDPDDDDVEKP